MISFFFIRCLVAAQGGQVDISDDYCEGEQGELLIQTPSLFQEYWGKPLATKETFHKGCFIYFC